MIVTAQRILDCVPPPTMRPWARALKARCELLVPEWSLDHGWMPGRGVPLAESRIGPKWEFCDIMSFFTSISQERLWGLIPEDDLRWQLQRFFSKVGCIEGIPEGCSFAPSLANLYLAEIDSRWQDHMVRVGDNFACDDRRRLTKELRDIGLRAKPRDTFVSPSNQTPSVMAVW